MMPATILHEAEIELWDAVAYYDDQSHGLGLDFEDFIPPRYNSHHSSHD